MKRTLIIVLVFLLAGTLLFGTRSINFKLGIFSPSLESDLWETNLENLSFTKEDFSDLYYGVEYENFVGNFLSLSIEGGTFSKTIYSAYSDYVYDDNSPVNQNMFLRISSLELGFKLYPIGFKRVFIPFVGVGAGIYSWRYEQWGDFIDFEYGTIQEGYADTVTITPGFNIKGGLILRFRRNIGVSFESKYQYLKGTLSSLFEGFGKLDLSGLTYSLGINLYIR